MIDVIQSIYSGHGRLGQIKAEYGGTRILKQESASRKTRRKRRGGGEEAAVAGARGSQHVVVGLRRSMPSTASRPCRQTHTDREDGQLFPFFFAFRGCVAATRGEFTSENVPNDAARRTDLKLRPPPTSAPAGSVQHGQVYMPIGRARLQGALTRAAPLRRSALTHPPEWPVTSAARRRKCLCRRA